MNIYSYSFPVVCPNDGENIIFNLSIETKETVYVEHIKAFLSLHRTAFQEVLADKLHTKFGGLQRIEAEHQGVLIVTIRGQ